MLKTATTCLETGRKVIIIGLTLQEMTEMCRQPSKAIMVESSDLGASVDVVIFQGSTEAEMLQAIDPILTPATKITIDDKLKN